MEKRPDIDRRRAGELAECSGAPPEWRFPDTVRGVLEVDLGDVVSRVRASPGLVAADENNWAVRMQATRKRFGKDSKRIYGHFVVLPDPDDKVSAEERAHVADEWAGAMLPGFEHAVVIHDDNKTGITHDHVVVNTVHPKTGHKIQVSDGDIYRQWDKLQRICEDHGLVFHRPGGGEHAMRACAAKHGAECTEDALRARLGADFDAMWHGRPSADACVPPAARALRERHNVHAPGSSWAPVDRTMGD